MENASKALLIAGVLLITLAVVSIIMVIFNKAEDFNEKQAQDFTKKSIAYHNSQFSIYERTLSKSEFNKLIDVIIKSNKNATKPEYEVSISLNGIKYIFNDENSKLISEDNVNIKDIEMDSLDEFSCTTLTNSYGIINEINIIKK